MVPLEKQREFTEIGDFHEAGGGCEIRVVLVFQEKDTPNSEKKTPLFGERAPGSALFWFGSPERLLSEHALVGYGRFFFETSLILRASNISRVFVTLPLMLLHRKTHAFAGEQRPFYAIKAKTEMRHSCLKHQKDDIHACKTR